MATFPSLREPVIEGILRVGETANIIAPSKAKKSWLVTNTALGVATGRPWLGRAVATGEVLIIGNELHPETSASRLRTVAEAMGLREEEYGGRLFVENLRGRLTSLSEMVHYFDDRKAGRFKIIILDAWYRFQEPGTDENDNAATTQAYNTLDRIAGRLGTSFICIHHASKGTQSGKGVTDVGAGAGAQSRACDTHLVLRPHLQTDAAVLEGRTRSWQDPEPTCLRWSYPLWQAAPELDPRQLEGPRPRGREGHGGAVERKSWTERQVADHVAGYVNGVSKDLLVDAVVEHNPGMSQRAALKVVTKAESQELIVRRAMGGNTPRPFFTPATAPTGLNGTADGKPCRRRSSPDVRAVARGHGSREFDS